MDERAKRISDSHRHSVTVSPYFAGGEKLMESWNAICDQAENRTKELVRQLRNMGIKAVHPNDGWVSRDNGVPYQIQFAYPDFIDTIQIGDKIALKGHDYDMGCKYISIYKVTDIISSGIKLNEYKIEYANEKYHYYEDGRLELVNNNDLLKAVSKIDHMTFLP